jgi:hypothetical protein
METGKDIISRGMKMLHETVPKFLPCSEDLLCVLEHPVRVLAEQELCVVETPVALDSSPLALVVFHHIPDRHPRVVCQTVEMD